MSPEHVNGFPFLVWSLSTPQEKSRKAIQKESRKATKSERALVRRHRRAREPKKPAAWQRAGAAWARSPRLNQPARRTQR
jgi:hypothetical protein